MSSRKDNFKHIRDTLPLPENFSEQLSHLHECPKNSHSPRWGQWEVCQLFQHLQPRSVKSSHTWSLFASLTHFCAIYWVTVFHLSDTGEPPPVEKIQVSAYLLLKLLTIKRSYIFGCRIFWICKCTCSWSKLLLHLETKFLKIVAVQLLPSSGYN